MDSGRPCSPGTRRSIGSRRSRPRSRGGLLVEDEAHGYSYGFVQSLAESARRHGARILPRRRVTRIRTSGGAVDGVVLDGPRETVPADLVVLAAGSWSATLVEPLGVELPLQPAKGYSATMDWFEGAPSMPVLIKERRVIITPLGERIRFGGTLELAGFDESVHGARYEAVIAGGAEVLSSPPSRQNEEPWSGLRPVTPDGLPVIDRSRTVEGLIVATGHAMLGFTPVPGYRAARRRARPRGRDVPRSLRVPARSVLSVSLLILTLVQPIQEVRVVGNRLTSDEAVRHHAAPVDRDHLDRSLRRLWETGLFDDLRLEMDGGRARDPRRGETPPGPVQHRR